MSLLSIIFLVLILLKLIIKIYLANRQIKLIKNNINHIPNNFINILNLDQHHNHSEYNIKKLNLSITQYLATTLLTLVMVFGSGINWCNIFVNKILLISNPYIHDTVIIVVYMIFSNLLSLIFSYYSIFEIEDKYGFNKMSVKIFFLDLIKSTLVSSIIFLPLLYLSFIIIYHFIYSWWILVFILLVTLNLLMLIIYPIVIAPLFNKFKPLEDLSLKLELENLIDKAGLFFKAIFVMDASKRSTHGNAYFTGFGRSKRIVFFDSLLNKLSNQEIVAVLAHELGHFKYKHIIKQMILSLGLMLLVLYLVSLLFYNSTLYHSLGVIEINAANGIIITMIILELLSFYISPFFKMLSRHHEFEADYFASTITNKQHLISGLIKLSSENAAVLYPDPWYVAVHYSHPSLGERIQNLINSDHK